MVTAINDIKAERFYERHSHRVSLNSFVRHTTTDALLVRVYIIIVYYRPIAKLSDQAFAQHRNEAYYAKRELH